MRILVTSGGTKVPIDPVRDLTNKSRGVFGASIAAALLQAGAEVIYLGAEDGHKPLCMAVGPDQLSDYERTLRRLADLHEQYTSCQGRYQEYRFRTYEDYGRLLRTLIVEGQPQAVVLAAAVSDYLVATPSPTKVRSQQELHLNLVPAAKLIGQVKDWHPTTFLVGFKLLVGATDEELIEAAWNSIQVNRCDLVVANDLRSLERGRHEIILVEPTQTAPGPAEPRLVTKLSTDLAHQLAQRILRSGT